MGYKVEGFTFETEEEARLASKEAEGIRYIRAQNNMRDPRTVLKLYNRLIEKEIFSTSVGLRFLAKLRRGLLSVPGIREEELLPLPADLSKGQGQEQEVSGGNQKKEEKKPKEGNKEGKDYYRPFVVSTFFAVVFAVALLGIFIIIAVSSDNVTILNYENSLIDRYETWEKELTQRERALKERESAVDAMELLAGTEGEFTE